MIEIPGKTGSIREEERCCRSLEASGVNWEEIAGQSEPSNQGGDDGSEPHEVIFAAERAIDRMLDRATPISASSLSVRAASSL